jgi:predicted ATP-binding protein involved in virulence
MILKSLSLANFRGFDQIELDFDSKRTVIAGVNGIGKSGILRALTVALSHLLPRMTDCQEEMLSFIDDDIKLEKPQLEVSAIFAVAGKRLHVDGVRQHVDEAALESHRKKLAEVRAKIADATKDKKTIPLKRLQREEQGLKALIGEEPERWNILLEQRSENDSAPELFHEGTAALVSTLKARPAHPIFVFFSTNRYQKVRSRKLSDPAQAEKTAAYQDAFDEEAKSYRFFLDWFRAQKELKGPGRGKRLGLLKAIETAAAEFVEGIKNFRLEYEPRVQFLVEKNGQTLSLNQLSDGERGLLALVFDIARRLAIANPEADDPIKDGKGIILIDEVELHLHPRWQRKVLRQLSKTFPKCQFIVTTHSPQVIGQSKPEQLRLLQKTTRGIRQKSVGQSFGMDSNWILEEIMGTPSRDHATEKKLREITDAIDDDELSTARALITELEDEVGLFPDLQEWKSMVDRLEMLGSDETD